MIARKLISLYCRKYAHIWININDTDFPSSQNVLHCIHAGAVEMTLELTILHKPEETNTSLQLKIIL